ncbi:MAG TPA: hypothetical protein VEA61_03365 [Allosphingosinicella sp.]|nr:hypothetical protein [Allosphingosinicella sp.]
MNVSLLPLLLALAGAGTQTGPAVAGYYRLVQEQDVASSLVLRPDGRFEYSLAAGALDERAEGRWSLADGLIVLATEPKPVPPP